MYFKSDVWSHASCNKSLNALFFCYFQTQFFFLFHAYNGSALTSCLPNSFIANLDIRNFSLPFYQTVNIKIDFDLIIALKYKIVSSMAFL